MKPRSLQKQPIAGCLISIRLKNSKTLYVISDDTCRRNILKYSIKRDVGEGKTTSGFKNFNAII
jgi:hypothetical protein